MEKQKSRTTILKRKLMKSSEEKYILFEDSIKRPLSTENCLIFLEDDLYRNIFILEYPFFESDENHLSYVKFITDQLTSSKIDLLTDLFLLSRKVGYYHEEFLFKIDRILSKNSHHILKLSSLDLVNSFFVQIPFNRYLEISKLALSKTKSKLIVFQATINLIILDKERYFPIVLRMLEDLGIPHFDYRLLSNLLEYSHFRTSISNEDLNKIKQICLLQKYNTVVLDEILLDIVQLEKILKS